MKLKPSPVVQTGSFAAVTFYSVCACVSLCVFHSLEKKQKKNKKQKQQKNKSQNYYWCSEHEVDKTRRYIEERSLSIRSSKGENKFVTEDSFVQGCALPDSVTALHFPSSPSSRIYQTMQRYDV